jgi:hypothetical protein
MDVFPALKPVKLSAADPGSLCARVFGDRLVLGMVLQLDQRQRYWVPFEGKDSAWVAQLFIPDHQRAETVLTVQGARFSLQIDKTGLGTCYDRALAGSVFVVNYGFAICVCVPDEGGRVFAIEDGSFVQVPEAVRSFPFFSSWKIEVPGGDGSWRSIFSREVDT